MRIARDPKTGRFLIGNRGGPGRPYAHEMTKAELRRQRQIIAAWRHCMNEGDPLAHMMEMLEGPKCPVCSRPMALTVWKTPRGLLFGRLPGRRHLSTAGGRAQTQREAEDQARRQARPARVGGIGRRGALDGPRAALGRVWANPCQPRAEPAPAVARSAPRCGAMPRSSPAGARTSTPSPCR